MNLPLILFCKTPAHQIIMEHQLSKQPIPELEQNQTNEKKSYKELSVRVNISDYEINQCFQKGMKEEHDRIQENYYDYYKVYLKHLYSDDPEYKLERAMATLKGMKETFDFKISLESATDQLHVRRLLDKNEYFSKNTKKPGLIVKLFKTEYNGRQAIVKTYLYDPTYKSLSYTVEFNFKNEAVFQLYTNRMHYQKKFISPELYSWGSLNKYAFEEGGYDYKCMFLIMEYVPHLTLKEAVYTADKMKTIYERISKIDEDLKTNLMHHNDLHKGNILVSEHSPLPEIVILDFGEASFGPRRPLYMSGIKM